MRSESQTGRERYSWWITLGIVIAGLALSVWVNFTVRGSAFTISPENWNRTLDIHLHVLPFAARPFQSYATVGFQFLTGLSPMVSFFVVEYLLAGLTALLFTGLLRRLGFTRAWCYIGAALFLLSFPVLAAHFAPVNTWDDFWLYLALIGTVLAVLNRRWPAAAVLFALACLARETGILFFPVLAAMAWRDRRRTKPWVLAVCLLAPLIAYGAYSALLTGRYSADVWRMFHHNFGDTPHAADSVISLFNAFGWLLPAAALGAWALWRRSRSEEERFLLLGMVLYLPINTVVASAFAMVRETRLLFPPFLFVIPLALVAVRDVWQSGLSRVVWWRWLLFGTLGALLCAGGLWLGPVLWPVLDYQTSGVFRRNMAGLALGLSLAFVLLWLHRSILDRGQKKHGHREPIGMTAGEKAARE